MGAPTKLAAEKPESNFKPVPPKTASKNSFVPTVRPNRRKNKHKTTRARPKKDRSQQETNDVLPQDKVKKILGIKGSGGSGDRNRAVSSSVYDPRPRFRK